MSSGAAVDLPGDLLEEILISLPVRSLVRFSSTCKSLGSLIKNPKFIANHAHRAQITSARSKNFSVVAISKRSPKLELKQYSVSDFDRHCCENDLNIPPLLSSIDDHYNPKDVIGCCRGLICLVCRPRSNQYATCIWNPATRDIKVIASENHRFGKAGFGFHNCINDYTFVRFQEPSCADDFFQLKVYSVCSGTWKISDKFLIKERGKLLGLSRLVFVNNGVCYWIAYEIVGGNLQLLPRLMSYDVVMRTLNKDIKLPNSFYDDAESSALDILELNEKLCLVYYTSAEGMIEFWFTDDHENRSQVSWTKSFSLNDTNYISLPSLLFTRSGEVLWQENSVGNVVMRKPSSDDEAIIKLPFSVPPFYQQMFLYEETLQSVSATTL